MSDLLVVVFKNQEDGGKALRAFRQIEKEGQVHLEDTALIVKGADGKVRVKNELDSGVEGGAVVGGVLGGIIFLAFPLAGVALGAAARSRHRSLARQGSRQEVRQGILRKS